MKTKEECKKILSKLGFKLGVSPALIATRLLSEDDKQDMVNGDLPLESLECAIKTWMHNGMPDYAHGLTDPMEKKF
jgi:hypothetical protein